MVSYRTIVPGMNDNVEQPNTMYQSGSMTQINNAPDPSTTKIPRIDESQVPHSQANTQSTKPLVGFLVSVSKYENGEFWVLRQGQNTIGASNECDIMLSDALVSGLHAVLAIHRNPQSDNLLSIGIMDKGSSNGVFVNGEYIGFNPFQCKNLDKIKIGNYEFLLMLFDAKVYEMKPAVALVPTDPASVASVENNSSYDYSSRDNYAEKSGVTQY